MSNKVPQIRFNGYSDAWEERKLIEVADYRNGKAHEKDISEDGYYIVVNSKFVSTNGLVKKYSDEMIAPLSKNEIAFVLSDVPNGRAIARTFLINEDNKYSLNQRIAGITPHADTNSYFLHSLMNRNHYFLRFDNGVSQTNLSKREVEKWVEFYPSYQEQQKIGSFFKQLDDTIALHQRKLDLLKEQKKGYLQKMLPKNGAKVPELRFAGFADDWEERKLGDFIDVKSGKDYKHLNSGSIPVYGTGGYMLSVDRALSDIDAIGIGRKGTIDKPYLLKAPFWTVDTLFYAVPKQNIDLQFSLSIFKKINWKKFDESTGVPSLSKTVINSVGASVPSYEEQQKIGSFFKQLDNTITLHQRKLDLLKEQKKGYLQKMFV
jgi:type I restriction enzyme S subunit